jgi:PelA/Pel-15E family pectate lyase
MYRLLFAPFVVLATLQCSAVNADDAQLRKQAAEALRKATDFFTSEVSTEGGYLWLYSEDLATREGEGRATDTLVWVQPPGTPTVGMVFLNAYRDTHDKHYLEAAKQAGYCLVRGQLRSGGWDYRIEFNPKNRKKYAYRVDEPVEGSSQRNTTTLDDNTTQAALRLLMQLDKTLDFKDAAIHEAAEFALKSLLKVQYPIGAWPQRFAAPPDPDKFPIKKASYPESWSWEHPKVSYSTFYTFNDNAINDVIDIMFMASDVYGDERYSAAARRCGDFIILAQMPEPQPAWAQQYDTEMHPAWARRFEPPSITGGESQGVMRALLQLYRNTGDKKYLEPIPRAIEYFRRSELPNGQLARFYELRTNKPLYFTIDYKLTYSDADMPTHYSFKSGNGMGGIEREYQRLLATDPAKLKPPTTRSRSKASKKTMQQVERVIASLDDRGRWVKSGRMKYHGDDDPARKVIDCRTFCSNIRVLSSYLATEPR